MWIWLHPLRKKTNECGATSSAKLEKQESETPKTSVKKPPPRNKKTARVPERRFLWNRGKQRERISQKKTFKPSEVVKSAIKRIEKQSEESRPKQIEEAIAS